MIGKTSLPAGVLVALIYLMPTSAFAQSDSASPSRVSDAPRQAPLGNAEAGQPPKASAIPFDAAPVGADRSATRPGAEPAGSAAAPPASGEAEQLHEALAAFLAPPTRKRESVAARKRREAIAAFYAARSYQPLWLVKGDWSAAARAVAARLEQADDDGLEASALAIPKLASGDGASLAASELALTASVVLYGEQASGGRIAPHAISPQIADNHTRLKPAEILARMAAAKDPGQTLAGFNPPQAGYRALRAQLAAIRAHGGKAALASIPSGGTLRIGMRDRRVPLLRDRLSLPAAPGDQNLVYDRKLAHAVAEFQRQARLPPSGALTPRTAAALSGKGTGELRSEIIANMELWRWSPRDLGADHIEVNIPDFSLRLYRDDKLAWRTRVVVGKATTPTPVFSDLVRYVVVNPSWEVPQSIIKKEMLPKLAEDPLYLQRLGYQVTYKGNLMEVRQPPGDHNALGRIKFLFPNNYAVYLHDTPERALFKASQRDFSHGCVRVQDPFALGQDVLGVANGWSETRLKKLIGDKERTIKVARPLPIHIEYFTAFVDENGRLQVRPDVYGYVRKIERDLRLPR